MPVFSVIVPLYNKENFIESTLKSILDQAFTNFEVLVIDDASTDCSLQIVSGIASDKVRIIKHQSNQGLSASRNTGIAAASGHYIAFLDADDRWETNYLETLFSLINQFPKAKLFATKYLEVHSKSVALSPKTRLQNKTENSIVADFFKSSLSQPIYCPSSLCVDKTVFEVIGSYDKQITFGEDVDFNIRANATFQLAYSAIPLVRYTVNSQNQITKSSLKKKIIPDFNSFEILAKKNPSLKQYLDFHRYIFAKMYKMEHDVATYKKLKKGIHKDATISGLNYKQRLLLNAPAAVLRIIPKIKRFLIVRGYRFTTY